MSDKNDISERWARLSGAKREVLERMLRRKVDSAFDPHTTLRRSGRLSAPLSFPQRRLWFLDQLEPGKSFYNITRAFLLRGPLNIDVLVRSLDEVVRRHESLRTNFQIIDDEPVQVITPDRSSGTVVKDLRDLPESEREPLMKELVIQQATTPFNLAEGALFRASLLQVNDREHVLSLTMHHIISDGWSMGVLFRELALLYEAFSTGSPSPLPELPIQYADYAVWQCQQWQGELRQNQLTYWRQQLSGAKATLELPQVQKRPAVQSF
ncbi:MAG TPA: condensation domain-containing protein, partial [Pyrinomonadaceae bacterium]